MEKHSEKGQALDILSVVGESSTELSKESLYFICDLIKKYKPKKIVEVGVSGGGDNMCNATMFGIIGL